MKCSYIVYVGGSGDHVGFPFFPTALIAMSIKNGVNVNVRVANGTNGYSLDGMTYYSIAEVREMVANAKKAIKALIEFSGNDDTEFGDKFYNEASDFYFGFLAHLEEDTPYVDDGVVYRDYSDVPFIRATDAKYFVKDFEHYDANGNLIVEDDNEDVG